MSFLSNHGTTVRSRPRNLSILLALIAITFVFSQAQTRLAAAVPQEDEGSLVADAKAQQPDEGRASEEQVKQNIAQRRQFYFNALFKELDNMVPGEYEDDSPQKAELARAVNAFLDREPEKASLIFEEQAAFDPDFPPKNLMLAAMSYIVRDARSGRVLLERAAKENPRYPGTYAAFARLAINEGRITDALALLEKVASAVRESKVSEKSKAHFGKQYIEGMLEVAIAQERFEDARELLQRQMDRTPDNPKSFLTGAELEFKAGQLDKSQSYLEKLKELLPATRPHESVFANWYRQLRKPAEAAIWIQAAAEKYPKDGTVQLDYARWALDRDDIATATSAVAKAESVLEASAGVKFIKGQLNFVDGKYAAAEALFEDVVKQQGSSVNADVLNFYALSLIESSDAAKQELAQKIAQQNLAQARGNKIAQANLAYILMKRGNLDHAQQLLFPVAQNSRVSPEVAYFFGVMVNELGKKDQARKALELALKHQGLFLYRKQAQQMLAELGEPTSDLPTPEASDK